MDRRDEELVVAAAVAARAEHDYQEWKIKKAEQERNTRRKR